MEMPETLASDTAKFKRPNGDSNSDDLSKFPLTKRTDPGQSQKVTFFPCTVVPDLTGGVTYFMCQASGYKLTSNKELPSPDQKFSRIIPKTSSIYSESTNTFKDTADSNQRYPMLAIIDVDGGSYSVKLARITNILGSGSKFTQTVYGKGTMGWEWLTESTNESDNYGSWGNTEAALLSL